MKPDWKPIAIMVAALAFAVIAPQAVIAFALATPVLLLLYLVYRFLRWLKRLRRWLSEGDSPT